MKICSTCGESKPEDNENFKLSRRKRKNGYVASYSSDCRACINAEYRKKHKERNQHKWVDEELGFKGIYKKFFCGITP